MQEIQLYIGSERVELFKDETISLTETIQNVRDVAKVFPFKLSFTFAELYSFSKLSNQDKSDSKSSPIISFKSDSSPKNVTL
jgi:hypothetical protein